jgi:hypothetical protein
MHQKIHVRTDDTAVPWLPRIQYILDFLKEHPVLQPLNITWILNSTTNSPLTSSDIHIYYGVGQPKQPCNFVIQPLLALIGAQPSSKKTWIMQPYYLQNKAIYSVELEKKQAISPFLLPQNDYTEMQYFGFDWLATLFFHLSRIEEYAPETTDDIGILPGEQLLCYRSGLHQRPLVDELVVALGEILTKSTPQLVSPVVASHDLDTLQLFNDKFNLARYLLGSAVRYKTIRQWPSIIADYMQVKSGKKSDPADTFDWLLDQNHAAQKFLFFGTGRPTKFDHFPDLNSSRMKTIRDQARQKGFQLGFHPSFNTWKNLDLWQQEQQIMADWQDAPIRHSRQHFLRFSFPETADILEQSGIETDSTLGFRHQIGFRCGTGFPFHLYHFKAERAYQWKEIPLIVMDIGLLRAAHYQGKHLLSAWHQFLSTTQYNTQININFHNPIFYEPELAGIPFIHLYQSLVSCAPYSTLEPISTTLLTQA